MNIVDVEKASPEELRRAVYRLNAQNQQLQLNLDAALAVLKQNGIAFGCKGCE